MTNEQRVSLVAHGLDELPDHVQYKSVSVKQNGSGVTLAVSQGKHERFIEMTLQQAEMVLVELFGVVLSAKKEETNEANTTRLG